MNKFYLKNQDVKKGASTIKWQTLLSREIVDNANHIIKRCYKDMETLPILLSILEQPSKKI